MIRFLRYRIIYFGVSLTLLVASIAALAIWGLVPSIDFSGGALVEVSFDRPVDLAVIAQELENYPVESIASTDTSGFVIRATDLKSADVNDFMEQIASSSAAVGQVVRHEQVGPTIGTQLLTKMAVAAVLAVGGILLYIAWTFKQLNYGLAAVAALLHDTIILFGTFALLGHFLLVEVDALFVTAVLTTMSFSVHDTIVVFDRIREKSQNSKRRALHTIINRALSETAVRSINNSLTIVFMLLALFLLGGTTIRWFVFALLIGTIAGTYSSPFVAAPILFELQKRKHART